MWMINMSTYYLLLLTLLAAKTTASDHYLLSCGAPSSVANTPSTYDGRTWYSDNNSTFSYHFSSTATATSPALNDAPQIPFSSARVFTSNFTYSFPVSPGPKFIRLFFHPSLYNSSYLTVESNTSHILLRNFSAYLSNSSFMFKEFYVHVNTSLLKLNFSPTSPSSHAFLNGIELVSVPETLYVGPAAPHYTAYPPVEFDLKNSTALETAYRLNVGGRDIGSEGDSGAMYRQWENDYDYLLGGFYGLTGLLDNETLIKYTRATPNYSAPVTVYQTFRSMGVHISNAQKMRMNVTWGFEVDLGFQYLLRLHWCEDVVDINATNYRVFDVFIDELIADQGVDVFSVVGGRTPMYRDYVVYMDGGGNTGRGVLQLAMHPTQSKYTVTDILLNGLEIFKLSRSDGSLDAPNPGPLGTTTPNQLPSPKSSSHINNVLIIIGSVVGSILLAFVVYYLFVRRGQCFFLQSTDPIDQQHWLVKEDVDPLQNKH